MAPRIANIVHIGRPSGQALTRKTAPMRKRIIVMTLGVALCAGGFAFWRVYGAQSVPQPQAPAPAVPVVAEKLQASARLYRKMRGISG